MYYWLYRILILTVCVCVCMGVLLLHTTYIVVSFFYVKYLVKCPSSLLQQCFIGC